ncbi:hypothetical protein T03_8990, partial [Trichinella britovi]
LSKIFQFQPKLSCILIAKGTHNKDAKIFGAIYLNKVSSNLSLCELCSYSSKEKFRLIIPKQFRPWSEDVFLYAPMTYDPMVILTIGNQNCVDQKAKQKFGEDIELLSVLDQTNNLKFPKAYLSGQMKKLFDDKSETAINTTFQKAGYSEERITEMIKEIYKSAEIIHVEQKHNPMDTDTSWIETTVFSVWDKEQTHIGSIERFVPVDGLSLTWRKVEKDVMESLNKKSNFRTDETHSKFKLKKYISFLPLLCLYGTVFLALLPIAIPFFITLLIAKRF